MRKSVSVAFFSLMSTLLIFGTVIMGGSELVLFSNYFAQERYDVLDEVVNVAQRTASHLVQEAALPEGEELEALNTKLELIGESAEVYLFFTDCDGNVVLASDPDDLAGDVVEASVLEKRICRRMPSEKVWVHRPPVPVFWKSWYLPVFWNEKRAGKRCSFSLPTMQFP